MRDSVRVRVVPVGEGRAGRRDTTAAADADTVEMWWGALWTGRALGAGNDAWWERGRCVRVAQADVALVDVAEGHRIVRACMYVCMCVRICVQSSSEPSTPDGGGRRGRADNEQATRKRKGEV